MGNDLLFGLADWTTISYLGLLIAIGSAILAKKDLILSLGVHLALEVREVGLERGRLRVLLGVASHPKTEIRVAAFEQGDELRGVPEAVGQYGKGCGTLGRIAPQSHNIAEPLRVDLIGEHLQFASRVSDAGQVRHHRKAEFAPQQGAHLRRPIPGGAPRAVGDRNEVGCHPAQRFRRATQRRDAGVILRRKEL